MTVIWVTQPQWVSHSCTETSTSTCIPDKLRQHHSCWCSGSLGHQVISKHMVSTMYDEWVLVFHKERFKLPPPFQSWEIMENANIFLCFYIYINSIQQGLQQIKKKVTISPVQLCGRFSSSNPFYQYGLTLIPAWIINHTLSKVSDGNYLSIPKLQQLHGWSLGMDK